MHASLDLRRLHDSISARLLSLKKLHSGLSSLSPRQQSLQLSFITIELDNLIIGALRAFTISTFRKARTVNGQRISLSINLSLEEEIGAFVLSVLNTVSFTKLKSPSRISRDKEHTMRDPKQVERVLQACNASNLPSLQKALSINSRIFRDVKFIRHFYAHRGSDTFLKARANAASMGILNVRHPDQILKYVIVGRPYSVLEEWLVDAEMFFGLLVE